MRSSIQTGLARKISFRFALTCLLLSAINLLSCSRSPAPDRSVKFIARLKSPALGQQVYLTGNTDQLGNWNPSAVPMTRESDSLWSTTLSIRNGESIEYKVTAGSWWTEALGTDETTYADFRLRVKSDTVVTIDVFDWRNRIKNGKPIFDAKRFHPKRPAMTLDNFWRYHSGDNAAWATPEYNDSIWTVTDSYIRWTQPSDPR